MSSPGHIVTDLELGQLLVAWATSLTDEEKAEVRAELMSWCERVESRLNAKKGANRG